MLTAFCSAELSEDGGAEQESEEELCGSRSSLERQGHRGNTTVHVCWHRNTSVSMVDFSVAVEVPNHLLHTLCFVSSSQTKENVWMSFVSSSYVFLSPSSVFVFVYLSSLRPLSRLLCANRQPVL